MRNWLSCCEDRLILSSRPEANVFFNSSEQGSYWNRWRPAYLERRAKNCTCSPVAGSHGTFISTEITNQRTGWIRPWELFSKAPDIIIFGLIVAAHLRLFKRIKSKWKLNRARQLRVVVIMNYENNSRVQLRGPTLYVRRSIAKCEKGAIIFIDININRHTFDIIVLVTFKRIVRLNERSN